MEDILHTAALYLSHLLEAITLVLLGIGALMAIKDLLAGGLARRPVNGITLGVWQGLSRWVIVGLEFLLAADLVSTVVSPSWDELGRLGVIAAIRTVLGYFLSRDLQEARKIARENAGLAQRDRGEPV